MSLNFKYIFVCISGTLLNETLIMISTSDYSVEEYLFYTRFSHMKPFRDCPIVFNNVLCMIGWLNLHPIAIPLYIVFQLFPSVHVLACVYWWLSINDVMPFMSPPPPCHVLKTPRAPLLHDGP